MRRAILAKAGNAPEELPTRPAGKTSPAQHKFEVQASKCTWKVSTAPGSALKMTVRATPRLLKLLATITVALQEKLEAPFERRDSL